MDIKTTIQKIWQNNKVYIIVFIVGFFIGSSGFWLGKGAADNDLRRTAVKLDNDLRAAQGRSADLEKQLSISTIQLGAFRVSIAADIRGSDQLTTNIDLAIADVIQLDRVIQSIQKGSE